VLVALGLQFTREKVGPLGPVGVLNLVAIAWLSFYPAQGPQYKSFRYQRDVELPAWSAVGRALATSFPPETLVAAVPIGAVGYYSNLRIIDLVGLTDRTIARTPAPRLGSGWPGHEKHNGPYVLSRRPEILLLGNVYVDARSELPAGAFPPFSNRQIRAREGDIVTDPRFSSEYELRHLAVESGRWLHFFARTDLAPSRP
jgi:hypothetical protein